MTDRSKARYMQARAKKILAEARERYGSGWALMSDDQRQNYIESRVLRLILAQGLEAYLPAQELAQCVLSEASKLNPCQALAPG